MQAFVNAIIITTVLLSIAGFFNAAMDTLAHHYGRSIFFKYQDVKFLGIKWFDYDFWNTATSWDNKYKERGDTRLANLIEKLDNGPLVFLTDGWHLMQFGMWTAVELIPLVWIQMYQPMQWWQWGVALMLEKIWVGGVFTFFYGDVLQVKK